MEKTSVGDKIKQLRTRKGLLQSDLADHLSVTNGAISNWETNRRLPSIEELKKICLFFDVPLDFFAEAPNFGFPEDHHHYQQLSKATSVTIRLQKPYCQACTYLLISAATLLLSGFLSGVVAIYLWFFAVFSIIVHVMTIQVQRNSRQEALSKTLQIEEGTRVAYLHPLDEDLMFKMKRTYARIIIFSFVMQIIFLITVYMMFSDLKFYLGIILMVFLTLAMFVFDYNRLFAFQDGQLMTKEVSYQDFHSGYRYLRFFVSVVMSIVSLLLVTAVFLLFEQTRELLFYRLIILGSIGVSFLFNYGLYVAMNKFKIGYEICLLDEHDQVTSI